MSIFPASGVARGRRLAPDRAGRLERHGALDRPISGQIYLIEEEDLETLQTARSPLSGLVSRH